jgi:hypothetical protein
VAPHNFDELLSGDKTFIVRGQTFTWRDVRPEVLTTLGQINGDEPDAIWAAQDDQILNFLVPEDHERWKNLRAREDEPITIRQFNAILEYLVEQQTDRPTQTPSPSASGRGKQGASSKAA